MDRDISFRYLQASWVLTPEPESRNVLLNELDRSNNTNPKRFRKSVELKGLPLRLSWRQVAGLALGFLVLVALAVAILAGFKSLIPASVPTVIPSAVPSAKPSSTPSATPLVTAPTMVARATSPATKEAPRPAPSGYQAIEDLSLWSTMNRKSVAINGVFSQETGALGHTYVFLMSADPPNGLFTTQPLLVVYDGLPDPNWRPGTRIVVYGQTSGYTVLLGARLPLLRADGVSVK